MPRPTETALKRRARALLEAMTARARWIYAVPPELGLTTALGVARSHGLREEAFVEGEAHFSDSVGLGKLRAIDLPELDITLIEAEGESMAALLAEILDQSGFYAQSTLLATALDERDPEAHKALCTLARMIVVWDKEWAALFQRHLRAVEPELRRQAVQALSMAVAAARDLGPAPALLEEAMSREVDPALKEAMDTTLAAMTRGK